MASDKTNVMRVLEQHKIAYKPHEYPHGKDAVDGVSVAELLGQNPDPAPGHTCCRTWES